MPFLKMQIYLSLYVYIFFFKTSLNLLDITSDVMKINKTILKNVQKEGRALKM